MKIKPDIKRIKERLEEIQKEIVKLINFKKLITNELDQIIKTMNSYYVIKSDILKNYEIKNRNYQTLQNLKEIYDNDDNILEKLKIINEGNNIDDKLSDIINLNSLFKSGDLNKVKIIYDPKIYFNIEEHNIKLFGHNFINNNKNNCLLLIKGKKNKLFEFLEIDSNIRKKETFEIELIETNPITNLSYMFDKCNSLLSLSNFKLDTRKVTDMSYMFNECDELKSFPDISELDTRKVTNMSHMFNKCNYLKAIPDISQWDTKNVEDMSYMFNCCHNLITFPDISSWDTKNVNNMKFMFSYCYNLKSLPDISRWNKNVTEKCDMFEGCFSTEKESLLKNTITLLFESNRFNNHISIKCYSGDKICDIFKLVCAKGGLYNEEDIVFLFNSRKINNNDQKTLKELGKELGIKNYSKILVIESTIVG